MFEATSKIKHNIKKEKWQEQDLDESVNSG